MTSPFADAIKALAFIAECVTPGTRGNQIARDAYEKKNGAAKESGSQEWHAARVACRPDCDGKREHYNRETAELTCACGAQK